MTIHRRVLCYVGPVILFSLLLNTPKFFETRIVFNSGDIRG